MATRKKAPTAAQLRARAAFTKVMKSGGFGAKKKTAAKRKRNPVGRSGASGRDVPVSKLDFARQQRALSGAPKRNPVARSRSGKSPWATNVGFPDFTRQSRALAGRASNPLKPVMAYVVHEARHGVKGKAVAAFPSKPAAVQFARAWTSMKQCPAIIAGRGAR